MTGPDLDNLPWLPRRFDEAMDVRRHRADVERLLAKVAQARRDLHDARAESERRYADPRKASRGAAVRHHLPRRNAAPNTG